MPCYVQFLQRVSVLVALAWLAIVAAGILGATRAWANLKLQARPRVPRWALSSHGPFVPSSAALTRAPQIEPIEGDVNAQAMAALSSWFPARALQEQTYLMLQASDGASQLASLPAARTAAQQLGAFAAHGISTGLLTADSGSSYFSFADAGLAQHAAGFVSQDGTAVLVRFSSTEGYQLSVQYNDFLKGLREELADVLDAAGGALHGGITGRLPISFDSATSITLDIAQSDAVTVTLSFLLLALALRSIRLIALTFLALCASFGAAFLLVWPLTTDMNTPNFTTSLVISTLVSLSLDYSLFLLSHLKGSLRAGLSMPEAVEASLRSSGHTILVSGSTLAACFLVLGIFPVSIVRAPGIATTFAVVMSVLVNLSLVPSLLLLFPNFFGGAALRCSCGPRSSSADDAAPAVESESSSSCLSWLLLPEPLASIDIWAELAKVTTRFKYSLTIGLLALLVAPFAYRLKHFETSLSLRNIMPREMESVETFYEMQDVFGPAATNGALLIGVATSAAQGAALTPAFFASAAAAVQAVVAASAPNELTASGVRGLAWNGAPADAAATAASVAAVAAGPATTAAACSAACSPQACSLRMLAASTLSADSRAMLLSVALNVDRLSPDGIEWADAARDALDAANAANGDVTWRLVVDATPDSVRYIYSHFGRLVGVTAAVVFFILLVAFRSVTNAARTVLSLAAMEVCVWGAAIAIYCQGELNPGGALHTFDDKTGLFWLMPILAFSLTTGLGLDYDIFITTSIMEEREAGWSDTDAVAIGLQRSGPIISWAGIIMAVAFGGFLFSEIPLLNQLGFFVVFAVLVDTFIVRPLLVPAMMNALGRANYWPRAIPPVTQPPLYGAEADAAAAKLAKEAAANEV